MDITSWVVLLLGAVGAIVAIFLKEVAQTALKRQILLGQLHAYVLHWRGQVARQPLAARLNTLVEEREKRVVDAYYKGRSAAISQIGENNKERDDAREKIKAEIENAAKSAEGLRKSEATTAIFSASIDTLAVSRQYLMDGKTFLSDSDAAHLGPAIASTVVQFRASAVQMFLAFEGLVRAANGMKDGESNEELLKLTSSLVDSIILDGEQYLVSLIRLDRNVERARQCNLVQHCWNILRGR